MAKISPLAKVAEDDRLQLLNDISELILQAKSLNLPETVLLLNMAHLDLQTKIHGINDEELNAFMNAVSASVSSH
ncbi:MAG: hypothetical protein ACRD9W_23755 [Terriglobia bacterium]